MAWLKLAWSFRNQIAIALALGYAVMWVWDYGSDHYDAGYNARVLEEQAASAEAVQIRDEVEHETRSMSKDELIDDLRFHGELRSPDDI